jgi:hypothetical protein
MFCESHFRSEGELHLSRARIGVDLSFEQARLSNPRGWALHGDALKVGGSLFVKNTVTEGPVRLVWGRIADQLVLAGAAQVEPDVVSWNLEGAHIGQLAVIPKERSPGWINLANAQVGILQDNEHAWRGGYELQGLQYDVLRREREITGRPSRWKRDRGVATRLAWLRGNRSGYEPQLYDQLADTYRQAGHEPHQKTVLIEKQRRRRGGLSLPARVWSWVQDGLFAYGYRNWQALAWFAGFWLFGAIFLASYRHDVVQTRPQEHVPAFHSWIYALDLLLPVVNLAQRNSWTTYGAAAFVATALIIVGWILTTAIVAALAGIVRRGD